MRDHGHRAGLLLAASVIAWASTAKANETVTYSYDSRGRLIATSTSGSVNNGVTTGIAYDPAGNRTTYNVTGVPTQPTPPTPPPPAFSVSGASVNEGGNLVFTISRSNQTAGTYTVNYATSNGSAAQYSDFHPASETLTFTTGAPQTVNILTIADTTAEPAETVLMTLSGPTGGATIQAGAGQAIGTINASGSSGPSSPPPGNQPPTTVSDSVSVNRCSSVVANVVANDTDPEGNNPLALLSVTYGGLRGTASMASSTSVQFNANYSSGPAVVSYQVGDSFGASSTGTLTVNIIAAGPC